MIRKRSLFRESEPWIRDRGLEADRLAPLAPLIEHEKSLREAVSKQVATPEQVQTAGAPPVLRNGLELINNLTMFGLIAIGGCLILGFLTPLAARSRRPRSWR